MDEQLTVARVTRVGDLVVNVEVATKKWLDANEHDPWFYWAPAPDKDGNSPQIGLKYDKSKGAFEVPVIKEENE